MGWDEMGWDEMGWDGLESCETTTRVWCSPSPLPIGASDAGPGCAASTRLHAGGGHTTSGSRERQLGGSCRQVPTSKYDTNTTPRHRGAQLVARRDTDAPPAHHATHPAQIPTLPPRFQGWHSEPSPQCTPTQGMTHPILNIDDATRVMTKSDQLSDASEHEETGCGWVGANRAARTEARGHDNEGRDACTKVASIVFNNGR